MKPSEAVRLATKVQAAWPGSGMGEASIAVYADGILTCDFETAAETVSRLVRECDRLPSVAHILAMCRVVRKEREDEQRQAALPEPGLMTFAEFLQTLPPEQRNRPGLRTLGQLMQSSTAPEAEADSA